MKRIWHPYTEWEDYKAGMWTQAAKTKRDEMLPKAIEFTGNTDLYGQYMLKVLEVYPKACEHNLTDSHINRRAWIGHAACCIALGCSEDITREAWWCLTEEQRRAADAKADEAIAIWEKAHEG